MLILRRLVILLLALTALFSVWVWWNRPQKVDMSTYAPDDSIAYFEANDLALILKGMTDTTAWKNLSSPAGMRGDLGNVGWLSKITAWTGVGPAETVVFSRAQVAVAVFGVENAKLRYALIIETHSSESRTLAVVEKRFGSFAQRAYGNPKLERKDSNNAKWLIWNAPSDGRKIIAAITNSLAIVGTDEESVLKCLAVRRGDAQNLSSNKDLQTMRLRLVNSDSVAFGLITPKGVAKMLETIGISYAMSLSDKREIGIAASLIPQLSSRLANPIGWSTRFVNGNVEDTYFLSLPNEVSSRLSSNLQPSPNVSLKAAELLPPDTFSITRYNVNNPHEAVKGLASALSVSVDAITASAIPLIFNTIFRSYGIEDADKFLQSVGNELYTARLDDKGNSTVVIVSVKDEAALKSIVNQKLGTQTPRSEQIGNITILVSPEAKRGAASFVNGYLIMGNTESVRDCIRAFSQQQTIHKSAPFQQSNTLLTNTSAANAITFTDDSAYAKALMMMFSTVSFAREKTPNQAEVEKASKELPYSVTQTGMMDGGIERKTYSAFGQFGNLAVQYGTR